MSSAKRKGDQFERDVVAVLRSCGFPHVERAYRLGAPDDRGDVNGMVGFLIECRNRRAISLAGWIDEIKVEAERHDVTPVLVVKRRGAPASRAYAVLELETFARLLCELHL